MAPLEMIAAGRSVLLRVHVEEPVDPADAMLIVDRGDDMQVVPPLDGGNGDALAFLVAASDIADGSRLVLNAGGVLEELAAELADDVG